MNYKENNRLMSRNVMIVLLINLVLIAITMSQNADDHCCRRVYSRKGGYNCDRGYQSLYDLCFTMQHTNEDGNPHYDEPLCPCEAGLQCEKNPDDAEYTFINELSKQEQKDVIYKGKRPDGLCYFPEDEVSTDLPIANILPLDTSVPIEGLAEDTGLQGDTGLPGDTGVKIKTGLPGDIGVPIKPDIPEDAGVPIKPGFPGDTGVPMQTGLPEDNDLSVFTFLLDPEVTRKSEKEETDELLWKELQEWIQDKAENMCDPDLIMRMIKHN